MSTRARLITRLVLFGIALLLIASLGLIGCETSRSSVAGLYVKQDEPNVYLQLNSDGTFAMPFGMEGNWQIDDNELTLIGPFGLGTAIIEGNRIITSDGDVFIKKGE